MNEKTIKSLIKLIAIFNIIRESEQNQSDIRDLRKILNNYYGIQKVNELVSYYQSAFENYNQNIEDKLQHLIFNETLVLCKNLNDSRSLFDKIIIAKHLLDYSYKTKEENPFINTFINIIFETLNIPSDLSKDLYHFGLREFDQVDPRNLLTISDQLENENNGKQLFDEYINGAIYLLYLKRFKVFLVLSQSKSIIQINNTKLSPQQAEIFNTGSLLKIDRSSYFYGPLLKSFIGVDESSKIELKAESISYQHNKSEIALFPFTGQFSSGNMYGILGSSGSGKTTLINLLSGIYKSHSGNISINDIPINGKADMNHLLGFVPQQDLLLESLSVYQNLYFTAQLVHPALSENQIKRKCKNLMQNLGLHDIRHLKVGSKLDKVISGGQRKRLNIALELIREPKILFVDEPTTGLSSKDSEIVMQILKEHALNGNIVITVIHQPSSDIFKSFDQVIFLDESYPIFFGNPLTALPYLNHISNHELDDQNLNCDYCSHINVEGIFDVIYQQTVDKFGNYTGKRKISPIEWYQHFNKGYNNENLNKGSRDWDIPIQINSSKIRQFFIFFRRDYLSKVASSSYTIVNLTIAPILALILSYIMKSYKGGSYSFSDNDNLPSYFFIFIISALFLGLVLSAEEILKDRNILRREHFLKLNWGAYVLSKVQMLFLISLIQGIFFTTIGNYVLEIKDFWWESFIMYMTCAVFANISGLILSRIIKSEKVIYIIIPLLIIPQIVLSGLLLPYNKTHPLIKKHDQTPFIADLVASRWAFEGLITEQFAHNPYEQYYFDNECDLKTTLWYLDYWLDAQYQILKKDGDVAQVNLNILKFLEESNIKDENLEFLANTDIKQNTESALNLLEQHFKNENRRYQAKKEALTEAVLESVGNENVKALKKEYYNLQVKKLLTRIDDEQAYEIENGEIIRVLDPIFNNQTGSFFSSSYYTPYKKVFGYKLKTYWANIIFINLISVLMLWTLTYQLGRKLRSFMKRKI